MEYNVAYSIHSHSAQDMLTSTCTHTYTNIHTNNIHTHSGGTMSFLLMSLRKGWLRASKADMRLVGSRVSSRSMRSSGISGILLQWEEGEGGSDVAVWDTGTVGEDGETGIELAMAFIGL